MERDSDYTGGVFSIGGVLVERREVDTLREPCNLNDFCGFDVDDDSGVEEACLIQGTTPRGDVLPTDKAARKTFPITTGCLDYFPDAIAAIAHLSWVGNQQHNPGEPLHWAREKSADQEDTMLRHFIDRGKIDTDGERHTTKAAWRLLAILQLEIEASKESV